MLFSRQFIVVDFVLGITTYRLSYLFLVQYMWYSVPAKKSRTLWQPSIKIELQLPSRLLHTIRTPYVFHLHMQCGEVKGVQCNLESSSIGILYMSCQVVVWCEVQ